MESDNGPIISIEAYEAERQALGANFGSEEEEDKDQVDEEPLGPLEDDLKEAEEMVAEEFVVLEQNTTEMKKTLEDSWRVMEGVHQSIVEIQTFLEKRHICVQ